MLFLFDTTCLDHALRAAALIIPGQEPVEPSQAPQRIHQESTGLQWRSKHPLTITEKPAIKRCLKTLHHNISVYEDVARCLPEQECVKPSSRPMRWPTRMPTWPSHPLREPFKAAPSTKQFTGSSSPDHLPPGADPALESQPPPLADPGEEERQGARRWVSRRILSPRAAGGTRTRGGDRNRIILSWK